MDAVKVVKNVRYIPVDEATIGSISSVYKYVLKIAPGPIPQNETIKAPNIATRQSPRMFLGSALKSPGTN